MKANITPVFKKSKKEDLANTGQSASPLGEVPGQVNERLILDVIPKQREEKKAIRNSQHGEIMLDQSGSLL